MNAVATVQTTTDQDGIVTARQLRIALTCLSNQSMTVAELRRKLFDLDAQDTPVKVVPSMWQELGIE